MRHLLNGEFVVSERHRTPSSGKCRCGHSNANLTSLSKLSLSTLSGCDTTIPPRCRLVSGDTNAGRWLLGDCPNVKREVRWRVRPLAGTTPGSATLRQRARLVADRVPPAWIGLCRNTRLAAVLSPDEEVDESHLLWKMAWPMPSRTRLARPSCRSWLIMMFGPSVRVTTSAAATPPLRHA